MMTNLIKSHARIAALLCGTILAGVGAAKADQVIPDDLIVQGSLCVGLDCVNNENFGFSTIRLKENNTRIEFQDTSTSAGFPANDWTITANDSASGGANYLAFDDVTGGKQPFRVTAGAPTASLFVDSTGRIGLRNSAPVLDLHMTTGNTPAIRLEQTNASGFAAQTWDVAGNEANFFVRDVTGGSRLPFRIRPGAPTSSLDIAASGNVGIGQASPGAKLDVQATGSTGLAAIFADNKADGIAFVRVDSQAGSAFFGTFNNYPAILRNTTTAAFHYDTNNNFGQVTGNLRVSNLLNCGGGVSTDGSGQLGCLASTRTVKNITGDLPLEVALSNVMALRPQTGSYKSTPDVPEHWLIAEEVDAIDPALAGRNDGRPHVVKTQNIVADLVAVVQQQQRRIDELEKRLTAK